VVIRRHWLAISGLGDFLKALLYRFSLGLLCRSEADICAVRFVNFLGCFEAGQPLPWASSTNDLFEI
jgi:hypothetical protein